MGLQAGEVSLWDTVWAVSHRELPQFVIMLELFYEDLGSQDQHDHRLLEHGVCRVQPCSAPPPYAPHSRSAAPSLSRCLSFTRSLSHTHSVSIPPPIPSLSLTLMRRVLLGPHTLQPLSAARHVEAE